jgi:Na+-transporting methylmalonyl-CoA/oxaloacetate decarboxylase gamma subunit
MRRTNMLNLVTVGGVAFILLVLAVLAFLRAFQAADSKEQLINYGTTIILLGMTLVLMHLVR